MTQRPAYNAYQITGGKPVHGDITCYGAKNFATKAMVAACLGQGPTVLTNVPKITEAEIVVDILQGLGATVTWESETTLQIDPTTINNSTIRLADSRRNRIPILFLPVLLHKFKQASVPHVVGDKIGARKVDFHTTAAELFGAIVTETGTTFDAHTAGPLQAAHYHLPYPSVGATETCLFLAVLAKGTSLITNAAIEPEIMELVTMLRSMGAIIFLGPNREIRVEGVSTLSGTRMAILGDRIEAASWASLACASDGRITVRGIQPQTLGNFLSTFRQIGGGFEIVAPDALTFFRAGPLQPILLETDVYPGFSTDWQQPFAVLLTQAEGVSVIHETVYENRFKYTQNLNQLGAKIQLSTHCMGAACRFQNRDHHHSALIMGKTPLVAVPEPLQAPDIRAGLAFLIAAAIADGTSLLTGIHELERGYGDLPKRLQNFSLDVSYATTV